MAIPCLLLVSACDGADATSDADAGSASMQEAEDDAAIADGTDADGMGTDGMSTDGMGADGSVVDDDATNPTAPGLSTFVGEPGGAECVQARHFLEVKADPANSAYAAPTLAVTCSGDTVTVKTNDIPNFKYEQKTPNALLPQNITHTFPRYPSPAASTTEVPLGGVVAVAVNGLSIFGPTEAPQMGYRDPYLDKLLDFCNGHTAPGGMYHLHARPDCLFTDLDGNTSLVVAYAFDGYPILAPYACTSDGDCTKVDKVDSSYQRVAAQWNGNTPLYSNTSKGSWDVFEYVAGSGDLDACNGRDLPGGGYAYYATDGFPYFIGCYRGTASAGHMH